jgi:predicted enzyme related to lactoylglutathione lyase
MSTHHAIDYIELGVKDLASSKTFYAVAFGWTFQRVRTGLPRHRCA